MRSWLLCVLVAVACGTEDVPPEPASIEITDGNGAPLGDVAFASTAIGQTAQTTIAVRNAGASPTGRLEVGVTGVSDFAIDAAATTCANTELGSGATCTIVVTFQPRATGVRSARLAVAGDPGGSATVALSGNALAGDAIVIEFAGDGGGEISAFAQGVVIGQCAADCAIAVTPGERLELVASAFSKYEGMAGACTSTSGLCAFTAATGAQPLTVAFSKHPGEVWTRVVFPDEPIHTATFDAAGNLVIGTAAHVAKLSPDGTQVWALDLPAVSLATGPGDAVYVDTGTDIVKLTAAGVQDWSQPLDPHAEGCPTVDGFVHCIAVASDGAVAIHGTTGVARWTSSGALAWSKPVTGDGIYGIAIDAQGNVLASVLDPVSAEDTVIVRFGPDGSPLAAPSFFSPQYHGMIALDAGGQLIASTSGHGDVYLTSPAVTRSVPVADPDFTRNGVASASGNLAWLHYPTDGEPPASWVATRFAGATETALVHDNVDTMNFGLRGSEPLDVAMAATGHLAIVGAWYGSPGDVLRHGIVQLFAP